MQGVSNNVLIIFVKYPQAGRVKTRLAKDIGKQNAAELYRLFVEAVLKRTKDKNFRRIIFYTPQDKGNEIKKWLVPSFKGMRKDYPLGLDPSLKCIRKDYPLGLGSSGLEFYPQKGRDLGKRLCNAFSNGFAASAQRVVIIGTDCPMIDKEIINSAFASLESKQCVIGPSLDGGYYLIGLSLLKEDIFKGICWGTKKVFSQTLYRLRATKMKYHILNPLFDIDTYQDAALLKEKLEWTQRIPAGLGPLLCKLRKICSHVSHPLPPNGGVPKAAEKDIFYLTRVGGYGILHL